MSAPVEIAPAITRPTSDVLGPPAVLPVATVAAPTAAVGIPTTTSTGSRPSPTRGRRSRSPPTFAADPIDWRNPVPGVPIFLSGLVPGLPTIPAAGRHSNTDAFTVGSACCPRPLPPGIPPLRIGEFTPGWGKTPPAAIPGARWLNL